MSQNKLAEILKHDSSFKELYEKHASEIDAINKLKKEMNAVILAHNYMAPDIFLTVADLVGDSLGLAFDAVETKADIILMAGVHFMAETAKLMSPAKTVLIPDMEAGCSLASSITANNIEKLRQKHPNVPVVCYANTTAEVKAASDICCTSANAVKVVESLGTEEVIFLPDENLASYAASKSKIKIITWKGDCEVHVLFTKEDIDKCREKYPDTVILAHPECKRDVLEASDFIGSTSGMIKYVRENRPKHASIITECSMGAILALENPDIHFNMPCYKCPHMELITIPKILSSLQNMEHKVEIDAGIAVNARKSVERMLALGK